MKWISTAILDDKFDLLELVEERRFDVMKALLGFFKSRCSDRGLLWNYLSVCNMSDFTTICCDFSKNNLELDGYNALSYQGYPIDYICQAGAKTHETTKIIRFKGGMFAQTSLDGL